MTRFVNRYGASQLVVTSSFVLARLANATPKKAFASGVTGQRRVEALGASTRYQPLLVIVEHNSCASACRLFRFASNENIKHSAIDSLSIQSKFCLFFIESCVSRKSSAKQLCLRILSPYGTANSI